MTFWDVQRILELVAQHSLPSTRVVLNSYSRLWSFPGSCGNARLANPVEPKLADKRRPQKPAVPAGFETIRGFSEIIWPLRTPGLDFLCNRYWQSWDCLVDGNHEFSGGAPAAETAEDREPVVSVIVPARNEAGNIRRIFEETPSLAQGLN